MVVTASSRARNGLVPPTLWPQELVWQNFVDAVNFIPFWTFLRNTVIITAFTVIASVIANPFIAYGFSRIDWPGRDKVFYVLWRPSSSPSGGARGSSTSSPRWDGSTPTCR